MSVDGLLLLRHASLLLIAACFLGTPEALAAAGGGGGGGGGSGGRAPASNGAYQKGVELFEAGDCKKAEKKFRKVLDEASRNAQANYMRGRALQCLDNHKKAVTYLRRAVKYDKSLYPAYASLGISYLELEKPTKANEQLQALAKLRRECGEKCSKRLIGAQDELSAALSADREGAAEGKTGRAEPADGRQHALLFTGVSDPQSSYFSAVALINAESFDAAISELQELMLAIGPVPDVLNYLGYAHRRLGRFEESLAYYEQALALDPLHRGANEYLGELFVELGRTEEARERLDVLGRACPFGCAEYEDLKRRIDARIVAEH
jgi:tetratricopeptide (TPR) repeat protein